ncbi:MAG: cellulose biosynthesis cyclic di-GMP-binding regulatory protein BcsB [Elusimicrobia bacterium]|nr:cellulose biosynthesis cyclic di-GMP-binding regulatory protein BcsB [Elusimicrobiota bacterium]
MGKRSALAVAAAILLSSVSSRTARAETLRLPLGKLSRVGRVDLKCVAAEYRISIPIPERWKIKKASISFGIVNSAALLAGRSRLMTKLNGDLVSQTQLNPLAPERTVTVPLPAARLKHGYNDLDFVVQQHYSTGCEFPCEPELWTTLKLGDDDAVLEMEYSLEKVPSNLSSIANFLFDPKTNPRGTVNIVLPDDAAETIAVASIIASGVAKRYDYKSVDFTVSREVVAGCDNIIIGDGRAVGKALGASPFDEKAVKGPFLKIMPLPRARGGSSPREDGADPYHALIVVSGLSQDHLKLAAETFAIMSAPFPLTDEMTVTGIVMPDIPLYGGKSVVKADTTYTFRSLNFPSHTFAGGNANGAEISFRLPADFLIKQNLYAQLSLHYSYGAANRADSVFNIMLNGKLIRGIRLDDDRGALIEGYKLDIPTYLFKPGDNLLRFEPVLTPLIGKNCEYMQTQNLFLTIMENSTIKFPPMPHYVDMPRLELFMLNGFPATRWPDGHGSRIYLTNSSHETIEAALNLVGMITQKNGHPLMGLEYTLKPPEKYDGELVIVGGIGELPARLAGSSPLSLGKELSFPYPVVQGWAEEAQFAFSKQLSGLGPGTGSLMEFRSPYADGRTAVMLAASSPRDLRALSVALMEPAVQANVKGDLVLIGLDDPEKNIIAVSIGKKYFAGKAGPLSRFDAYLYAYPWAYDALLGLVVLALSLSLFYFLNRYRKKRMTGA